MHFTLVFTGKFNILLEDLEGTVKTMKMGTYSGSASPHACVLEHSSLLTCYF